MKVGGDLWVRNIDYHHDTVLIAAEIAVIAVEVRVTRGAPRTVIANDVVYDREVRRFRCIDFGQPFASGRIADISEVADGDKRVIALAIDAASAVKDAAAGSLHAINNARLCGRRHVYRHELVTVRHTT